MENFRGYTSQDPKFVIHKQKFMQPVWDFRTGDKLNYKSKLTWLADLITRDSTFNEVEKLDEITRRRMLEKE